MKAYFHKTFVLERDNIAKILAFVSTNPTADRQLIAEHTGIGIGKNVSDGKVRPTIQYAVYAGLLTPESSDNKSPITLTEQGSLMFENDPRLKSRVTQWAMHYFLCREENEALVWSYFVHRFVPAHQQFDGETLSEGLRSNFVDLSEGGIADYRRILTSCYVDGNGLAKVGLIESHERNKYLRGRASYPNASLAAYLLAELWEAKHPDRAMVGADVLMLPGHFATTLNLSTGDVQHVLDDMTAAGFIRQSREAPPYQVIRQWNDKYELLRRAYDE